MVININKGRIIRETVWLDKFSTKSQKMLCKIQVHKERNTLNQDMDKKSAHLVKKYSSSANFSSLLLVG